LGFHFFLGGGIRLAHGDGPLDILGVANQLEIYPGLIF
jgi:hypothetical protein